MAHREYADLYLRLSLDRDGKTAIDRQEADCREWAAKNGLTVRQVHVDRGRSGYRDVVREGFNAAKAAVLSRAVDVLIVWQLDRLTRKGAAEVGPLLDELDRTGGRLVSVRDGLDSGSPDARIVMSAVSEWARAESQTMGERIRHAKRYLRSHGKWIGGQPPYGQMIDSTSGRLEPDPETAVYARLIADEALAGKTLLKIARLLNEYEIPSPRGGLWQVGTLSQLLKSPAFAGILPETESVWDEEQGRRRYTGTVRPYRDPQSGETVDIGEGIVTVDEQCRILKLLASRVGYGSNGEKTPRRPPKHLLTGLVFCAIDFCGMRMSVSGNSYVCQGVRLGHTCPGARAMAIAIDEYVARCFLERIPQLPVGHPTLEAMIDRRLRCRAPEVFARRSALEAEIIETDAQVAELEEARYLRGEFSDGGGSERFRRLAAMLSDRLSALEASLSGLPVLQAQSIDGAALTGIWQSSEVGAKRTLLASAIDRIMVTRAEGRGKRFDPEKRVRIEWAGERRQE
ncbi:MAG: site-specific recombinase [Streptomyces sp.]|jgi:DNA invertase Pin-like site-specific DNA recombinase|nr:site-specific recombinase [Streptomyces sp.]